DGAQLQLQGNFTVTGEALTLSGTGINNTGALLDTGGNNIWRGPVTLDSKPFLLLPNNVPATTPPRAVPIGTAVAGDNLTIDGVTGRGGGPLGLTRVLPGGVILPRPNPYGGLTPVAAGQLRTQTGDALGTPPPAPPGVSIPASNNGGQGYAALGFGDS